MEPTSMNDILSEKPVEKPAAEPAAEPKTEAAEQPDVERASSRRKEHQRREWEAQGRDPETGQFKKKEAEEPEAKVEKPAEKKEEPKVEAKTEPKPSPQQPEMTERERALLKAAQEERRKRQELEARLQQQPAPQQKPEEKKTFWDDPEGALAKHREEQQRSAMENRIATSEMIARSRHTDFDEKAAKFAALARTNQALAVQWIQAQDPSEFAYNYAKNVMDIEAAGGMDKLLEDRVSKARAEERAKVESEFKAKLEEAEKKRAALPGTLSDVKGAATRASAPVFTGPTSMEDILAR